jgi:hypothetical protein
MRFRQVTFKILPSVAVAFLFLFLTASPICAQGDPPLTKGNIIKHWERNPQQDAGAYINNTLRKRKVGFLPTKGVRHELRTRGVPREVIDALRSNFHDDNEFKFQVWVFESKPGGLQSEELTNLARAIIAELDSQYSNLADVFRHFKPPLPEPCVQTRDGTGCPSSTRPVLQVKGSVGKSGNKLNAVVRLSYASPVEDQPIGQGEVTVIRSRNDEGLRNAAAEIVRKIHDNIRREVKEF